MLVKYQTGFKGGYGTIVEAYRGYFWYPGGLNFVSTFVPVNKDGTVDGYELKPGIGFKVLPFGGRNIVNLCIDRCIPWDEEARGLFTMIKMGVDISHLVKVT